MKRPSAGEIFHDTRAVRPDALSRSQELRLDSIARYLQDAGLDHLSSAGFRDIHPHWVLRRTIIDVHTHRPEPDRFELHRWCAGLNSRWMTARIDLDAADLHVETEGFWVNFSVDTQMPTPLSPEFMTKMATTAVDEKLRWKRMLDPVPAADARELAWEIRANDIDLFIHVTNAVYWSMLEHAIDRAGMRVGERPYRYVVEHDSALAPDARVRLLCAVDGDRLDLWVMDIPADGSPERVAAACSAIPLEVNG